jgi:DNA polymerase-3 subunit epsilon
MTLFLDTETTGIPLYGERSTHPNQPHLVEIAGILVDHDWKVVDTYHAIIRPMGWNIPQNVTAIHGITEAMATENGILEDQALAGFFALAQRANLRVAYNEQFDARILRIAALRHDPSKADWWANMPSQCAMRLTQNLIGGKVPTLYESHQVILGRQMKRQHTALGDAQACMDVFKALATGAARSKVQAPKPVRQVAKSALSKAINMGRDTIKAAFHA